eukprot:1232421-Rhodomonas_salina.1
MLLPVASGDGLRAPERAIYYTISYPISYAISLPKSYAISLPEAYAISLPKTYALSGTEVGVLLCRTAREKLSFRVWCCEFNPVPPYGCASTKGGMALRQVLVAKLKDLFVGHGGIAYQVSYQPTRETHKNGSCPPMVLRGPYAMSGTDLLYAATPLGVRSRWFLYWLP